MRREVEYTIPGAKAEKPGQRDNGKTFVITEMSSDAGERWAIRAFLALANAGASIPEGFNIWTAGLAGFAVLGVQSFLALKHEAIEPLLEDMFDAITIKPPGWKRGLPLQEILKGAHTQIEEVKTRLLLRDQWLELHLGFSLRAAALKAAEAESKKAKASPPSIAPTSQG